jgi:hypothetical protein
LFGVLGFLSPFQPYTLRRAYADLPTALTIVHFDGTHPIPPYYMSKIHDPIENIAIDIHGYLDSDFSGSHVACTQNASYNLNGLTGWLREHYLKARKYKSAVSK